MSRVSSPPVVTTATATAAAVALFAAGAAAAASPDVPHYEFGPLLFGLAALVVIAKAGGVVAQRIGAPPVLGELLAGVSLANLLPYALGGSGIEFARANPALLFLAEIGVLVLLFDVGLEADLRALLRVGSSSLLVAIIGVAAPLVLGWGASALLLPEAGTLTHVFVGATLSATSIGITVRVLKDIGRTQALESQIILGAAILDDILALLLLSVVTAVIAQADTGASLSVTAILGLLARAVLFLGVTIALSRYVATAIVRVADWSEQQGMLLVLGLGVCFTLAYVAELVGLAGIIGAFAAGVMLDPYGQGIRTREEQETLTRLIQPLFAFFGPLFFVLIGMQVSLESFASASVLALGALLIVCAIVGKLACAAGVLDRRADRWIVGIGMIPRGEVGLIFASIGSRLDVNGEPVLGQGAFSAVVLMVLVTTLAAPLALRWSFERHG